MIAYTITAPLANGTTYERTESGSGEDISIGSWDQTEGYTYRKNFGSGANTLNIGADGGETHKGKNQNSRGEVYPYPVFGGGFVDRPISQAANNSGEVIYQPNGNYVRNGGGSFSRGGYIDSPNYITQYDDSGNNSEGGHVMAFLTAAPEGGGAGSPIQGANGTTTYSQARYFNTIALQTTTQTTVTNNYKITTTTQEKLAKVGTTITQSVGTSVVTLPTTTNAKSWTENTTTNTTATEDATVVTTSMGIDSYWKKTAHTVYILGKGETTAFLKSNAALNATNGGPTDTAAYDTYSGPTTFTITRVAGTTSQKPVVADTATDIGFEAGEGSGTTVTNRWIVGANSEGVYYYPGYPHHLPLSSTNITIQTGVTESSETQDGYKDGTGQWGANAKTTTRSAWGQTSATYSLAGVSYTEGIPTYTQETYAQPIVRSGSGSYKNDGPTLDEDGNEVTGITFSGAGANGFGEQANYFVNFQNQGRQNNGGGADAFYGLAYAWGTLGGTTAEPYQSISVNGIDSSESVTWPFVSISAGVQTPKPFVTVSQIPSTSATSSTAATKTEITTRRIWGEEFFKLTSSQETASTTVGAGTSTSSAKAITGTCSSFAIDFSNLEISETSLSRLSYFCFIDINCK